MKLCSKSKTSMQEAHSYCTPCQSLYRTENKSRISKQRKQYRIENKEAIIAKRKAYRLANLEKYKQRSRDFYHATKDKHREKKNASKRAYYQKNKAKHLEQTTKRRRELKQRTLGQDIAMEICRTYIRALGLEVEHIIPIRGKHVSGLHVPWNICPLPRSLNMQKNNKFDNDSYQAWRKAGGLKSGPYLPK